MIKQREFDFIGNRKKYFTLSAVLIAIVILASFIFGADLDIRFKGGTILSYSYAGETGAVDLDEVKKQAEDILGDEVTVSEKYNKLTESNGFEISLASNQSVNSDVQAKLDEKLTEDFAEQEIKQLSITSVNASMGKEFFIKCLVAVGFGSLLMIVYIALRFKKISGWSAGVMAVIALFHDILMVYGVFIICRIPINDSFIAVVLTILGYSVNDTIVIYDRIRENKRLYGRTKTIGEIVNDSINQTLTRSINTSVATVISMVVVCVVAMVMGVESILSFALPMIAGLICGAYSSICIASPLWVVWQNHKEMKAANGKGKK